MRFFEWVSEHVSFMGTGLRTTFRLAVGHQSGFFGNRPAFDKTGVDFDLARQLYRNDGSDSALGAGFCKPIIDRSVEFMGMPYISSDNESIDAAVNTAIERYWRPQLAEMFRNSMRDSVTYARVWQPLANDKLVTEEERQACHITLYEPERIRVQYDPQNPKRILQATIVTDVEFPDEVDPTVDAPRGTMGKVKTHEIWEVIDPDKYRYYDRTDRVWIDKWSRANKDGFVPIVEVWNEFDSALGGGQSDLESVYPFVKAFHEVLRQSLQAHTYHSTPKLRFKVTDVLGFLKNNFPDTVSAEGTIIPNSTISWKGREVLFIGEDEEIDFIEATSVLGDSKVLLEFLIDCISIASETPEWAFMRVEGGTSQGAMNAQTVPYEKKIDRKRVMFGEPVQMLVKMMLAINNKKPDSVDILWTEIRVDTLVSLTQSMQQFAMTLEVLLERKLISDNTAREALRQFRVFKTMKPPAQEAADAKTNVTLTPPPAPALPTGAKPTGSNQNGKAQLPVASGRTGGN